MSLAPSKKIHWNICTYEPLSFKGEDFLSVKKSRWPPSLTSATPIPICTVYPKKYAHGFVVLCFVVVMQSFIMNSHEVFIHIHQGCFAGTGAIVRLPQCQWSKPDGYGKISQCITTTKHSKAKPVCIFLGIYCRFYFYLRGVVLEAGHGQVIPSHSICVMELLVLALNNLRLGLSVLFPMF